MSYKFGSLQGADKIQHKYGDVFRHEVYPGWSRVTIAPDARQIALMLEIARQWNGPYGILYVLLLSRPGCHTPARYQSPEPCSFQDLERFARTFEDYFEGDGRHHLWFIDVPTSSRLVYDNHNLIYAYGNDDDVIALLNSKGLSAGDPNIPCGHFHNYNPEFDRSEDDIMAYFDWKEFPLQEEHDDP